MTKNLDKAMLQNYLYARNKIDKSANKIASISSILTCFKHSGDDTLSISPQALASLNEQINRNICRILETLDDFIHIQDAEDTLERTNI